MTNLFATPTSNKIGLLCRDLQSYTLRLWMSARRQSISKKPNSNFQSSQKAGVSLQQLFRDELGQDQTLDVALPFLRSNGRLEADIFEVWIARRLASGWIDDNESRVREIPSFLPSFDSCKVHKVAPNKGEKLRRHQASKTRSHFSRSKGYTASTSNRRAKGPSTPCSIQNKTGITDNTFKNIYGISATFEAAATGAEGLDRENSKNHGHTVVAALQKYGLHPRTILQRKPHRRKGLIDTSSHRVLFAESVRLTELHAKLRGTMETRTFPQQSGNPYLNPA